MSLMPIDTRIMTFGLMELCVLQTPIVVHRWLAHSELMAHARHTSLKSQQPYLRNSAADSAKFQVALSPVPIPPVST